MEALREPSIKSDGRWIKPWRSQVDSIGAVTRVSGIVLPFVVGHLWLAGDVLGRVQLAADLADIWKESI